MKNIDGIKSFEQIKVLADARRMTILRRLMAAPATLSQLSREMGHSPAWVQHHIKELLSANLIETGEIRTTGKVTEKYYRALSDALFLQELILPISEQPVLIFSGSHDLGLEGVFSHITRFANVLNMPTGSLNGLVNLRMGLCQISGAHLLDENGLYNTPFVNHFFPDRKMNVITLANRTQGLILAENNPKQIRELGDLTRPNVRFVNRNPGSGTRLWLDAELRKRQISPDSISGYANFVNTHSAAANIIKSGQADVTLGQQAAAHLSGLDYIPLFEERYDLVFPFEEQQRLLPILEYIQTLDFRKSLLTLTGYNTSHSGESIKLE